ncbi:MFS transporter [Candidatus Thorarchaeota archaeon]|nr:MAG: MFS transporter [Candidatus Thorarchaeota archaeon]
MKRNVKMHEDEIELETTPADEHKETGFDQDSQSQMRWLYVLAIGLGFFTTGISWSVYNSYLPAEFLPTFIVGDLQNTIIGAIMVLDNILAVVIQPYIGAKSDSTRTRWGRRMPYIMVGTPIAAAFFTLIAYGWAVFGFWFMLAIITIFNISMAFYRAPVVALMPDLVSSEHRTKANGIINLMGGIGAIYAFAIASRIFKINSPALGALLGVTAAQVGPILTFLSTSIIMVVAVIILFFAIKEPQVPPVDADKPREIGIIEAFREVSFSEDKSAAAILGAIFMWFFGYNAIETWFTKYGNEILGFAVEDASFLLTGIALSFVIFAVPAGLLAEKLGRRNTILVGLLIMHASLIALWFSADYNTILGIFAVAGIGWAFVNVNSIVIMWELLGKVRIGAGTGLYYAASMGAAIVGPFVAGVFFDLTSISFLFPLSLVFFIVAFILTLAVRTGEVGDESKSEMAA